MGQNWDMNNTPIYSTFLGKDIPKGTLGCSERSVVIEVRPDVGYNTSSLAVTT